MPDDQFGEEVGAKIYVSRAVDEDELSALLAERLAKLEIPRYIFQTTEPLSRTATGKIAKRQMKGETFEALELNPLGIL